MTLANRLRTKMRWCGITSQQELARLSGVPQSCIHRILTRGDGYSPKRATLLALAHALNTTAVWLSDGIDEHLARTPGARAAACDTLHDSAFSTAGYALGTLPRGARAGAPPDRDQLEIERLVRVLEPSERRKLLAVVRLIVQRQRPS